MMSVEPALARCLKVAKKIMSDHDTVIRMGYTHISVTAITSDPNELPMRSLPCIVNWLEASLSGAAENPLLAIA